MAAASNRRVGYGDPLGECLLRVLGIDPGIATCGFAVVDQGPGARRAAAVVFGAIRPHGPGDLKRLVELHRVIGQMIAEHGPGAAVVERLYHNRNVRTAAAVGQARGVILLALAQAGVPVDEATPTEMKLAVAGYGGADKRQVGAMVAAQFGLPCPPTPDDAADALGLCLWWLQGRGLRARLAAGTQGGGRM